MTTEPVRRTREELYQLVWSEPMQTVAKRFGISGVALAKNCRRMKIPVPGRGYWAKKAAGKRVTQVPLPRIPPNSSTHKQEIQFRPVADESPAAPIPEPLAVQEAFENDPANRIAVPDSLRSPHPLVKKTLEILTAPRDRERSFGARKPEPHLDVQVSKEQVRRALRIADALVKAFERRGWPVSVSISDDYKQIVKSHVTIFHQPVRFGVREPMKKVLNEPAKPQRLSDGRMYTPDQPKYRDERSGRLALVIIDSWGEAATFRCAETSTEPLEEELNDFVFAVAAEAYDRAEQHRRRIAVEQARWAAEERRQKEQERREIEVARGQKLEHDAARWMTHTQLLNFVAAVRAVAEEQAGAIGAETSLGQWLAWADQYAHSVNPLEQPLERLTVMPQPERRY